MALRSLKVVLVARSYNDLDCRIPLIHELASIEGFTASVLIIPTTSSSGLRVAHPLLVRMNIPCIYAYDLLRSKLARHLCYWMSRHVEQSSVPVVSHRVWSWIWRVMYIWLSKSSSIRNGVLQLASEAAVIIDDIAATPFRSFIVPLLANNKSLQLFCLSHGQNTYLNLWFDKLPDHRLEGSRGSILSIYTPSDNDSRILESNYRDVRAVTIGNTRFDTDWILDHQKRLLGQGKSLEDFSGTKIGFMMSKMEYGLDPAEVFLFVSKLALRDNTKIVLKPHTRGMSLREYRSRISDNVTIADNVSSSEIIDWADIVIFTGSSIIFEAMIKRKRVLFLAALQKYQTIFDALPPIAVLTAVGALDEAISRLEHEAYDYGAIEEFLASHTHNRIPGGRVCAAFAQHIVSELATEAE